jgi:hypothetical protein
VCYKPPSRLRRSATLKRGHIWLLDAPKDEGQHGCHVDAIWPLWAIFDFTPDGRGDFHPALRYDAHR